jgi:hypothetical protein
VDCTINILERKFSTGTGLTLAQSAPFMHVGNDEKLLWDDQFKPLLSPPGRDSVPIVDLAGPGPSVSCA